MKNRIELAQKHFKGNGVELGVAGGNFSVAILQNTGVRQLWSIDKWNDHHGIGEYFIARHKLQPFGSSSQVLRATFEEVVGFFEPDVFDFIYVDGYAHTGQNGGQTLRQWWPKVKPGGVFAGHDYCAKYQPTVDVVDAFVREHGLALQVTEESVKEHPSWWVVKPV